MRGSSVILGLAAFMLNPSLACGSGEADFQYGEAELKAAIEGTWSLELQASGSPSAVALRLEQAPENSTALHDVSFVTVAHACGTRTLLASASACSDSTEMPLRVSFVSGDQAFESAELSGVFRVDSLVFDAGDLYLSLGDMRLSARVQRSSEVESVRLEAPAEGTVRLERLAH